MITGILLIILIGFFTWRIASHFYIIPWPHWLSWMLESPNPYMMKVANSQDIVRRLDLQPGMKIADLGCGAGRILIPAAKKILPKGEASGFDIQEKMLAKTQKRANKHQLKNIKLSKSKLKSGILKEQYYDRIILVTVLGEVPDRLSILQEAYKSLKSGGVLSITEVIPDPCYIPSKQLQKFCEKVGFKHSQTWKSLLAYTMNFSKPD